MFKVGDELLAITEYAIERDWNKVSVLKVIDINIGPDGEPVYYVSYTLYKDRLEHYYSIKFIDKNFILKTKATKVLYE